MSDLGENDGGETVFAEAWPPNQREEDHVELKTVRLSLSLLTRSSSPLDCCRTNPFSRHSRQAIRQLRESDQGRMLAKGSWEETLVSIGKIDL